MGNYWQKNKVSTEQPRRCNLLRSHLNGYGSIWLSNQTLCNSQDRSVKTLIISNKCWKAVKGQLFLWLLGQISIKPKTKKRKTPFNMMKAMRIAQAISLHLGNLKRWCCAVVCCVYCYRTMVLKLQNESLKTAEKQTPIYVCAQIVE